jgi:hypothetical protein
VLNGQGDALSIVFGEICRSFVEHGVS